MADGTARSPVAVLGLVASVAAAAAGLLALVGDAGAVRGGAPAPWWVFVPLFALAEAFVIHLPTSRNAHTHSLREVPTVLALAFLDPLGYVAAHLLGAGGVLVLHNRQRGTKLAFNLCWFSLEAALGVVVYRAVLGGADVQTPRAWLAALLAAVVTDLVGAALVTVAIRLVEREADASILRSAATRGVIAAAANTCLASLVVVLVVAEPRALPLLGAVLLTVFAAYRVAVTLHRRSSQVELLYRFVDDAGRSVDLEATVRSVLRGARGLLGASAAQVVVLATDDRQGTRLRLDPGSDEVVAEGLHDVPEDAWWAPAAAGRSVLRTGHVDGAGAEGPRDGIAAPLSLAGAVQGVLLVTDRSFELDTFGAQDLRLLEALTGHAAVALSNSRLVDELQRLLARREHEAAHDALTGLPNRRAVLTRLGAAVTQGPAAVVVLEVDDAQDVDEVLGRAAGEALLRMLAARLETAVGAGVGRLDGACFALVLPGVGAGEAVERATEVLELLAEPVPLDGVPLYVTARGGVAAAPAHGSDPELLLHAASAAAHAAHRRGLAVDVHSDAATAAVTRRLLLAADLAAAVADGSLEVWFQPQADARTRAVTGVEALLRWQHPRLGFVPPLEIVALAERTGLMGAITEHVLTSALRERARCAAAGFPLDVSVNVTVDDVTDLRLPARVAELLRSVDVPARALTLEITEGGVMADPERAIAVLSALHALDVRLSVDDFGTGYSSLAYLERLPVHEVKVDQSFVRRLSDPRAASTVVSATVALGHELGLTVVAEGVEDDVHWHRVGDLGCDVVQGYALARPMPAAQVLPWLRSRVAVPSARV